MTLPVYDFSLRRPLAGALATFIDGIVASDGIDRPLNSEYLAAARIVSRKLADAVDDFVPLDVEEMDLLHRDVLPEYFASLGLTFNELFSQNQGAGQLLEVVEQMAAVGSFMSRLVQAINFDLFDEPWKGDRE